MMSGMELSCPKCQAPMRSYERSGVTVDQCTECRGIFLDRGELERLIDADARFHDQVRQVPASAPPPTQQAPVHGGQQYGAQPYGYKPHKRRKSFFEELFD